MARPTISLRAAIGPPDAIVVSPFIIGTSLIGGTDVIADTPVLGTQATWVELADRCTYISTRRGRNRLLEQYQAGTLGARFDNADGYLDPSWDDGPYADGEPLWDQNGDYLTDENGLILRITDGQSSIRPMRAISGVFTWAGVDYPFFFGFADNWDATYEYPEGGTVDVAATDAWKVLSRIDLLAGSSVGAGENTGARIGRILDAASWSVYYRDLDVGSNTHQATTLEGNVAAQVRLAAESERGDVYVDGAGNVTFRRRLSRYLDVRSRTVQWAIGDGAGELNPAAFTVSNDDALVRNDINLARVGGTTVTRRSVEGQVPYLRSSYNRTDLTLADDAQVADQADMLLHLFAFQEERIDSVTFEPDGDDDLWPLVVGARFGDRVSVNVTHPDTGNRLGGDYFVEGIDHDVPSLESGGKWRTTLRLADASKFPTNPFIIGTSLIGGSDVIT